MTTRTIFVTVGTTLFDPLIEAICCPSFLRTLLESNNGHQHYTHLIIQYGKGSIPSIATSPASTVERTTSIAQQSTTMQGIYHYDDDKHTQSGRSLRWEAYTFKPSLEKDMQDADLIISHAGAGSIMEGLAHCHHRNTSSGSCCDSMQQWKANSNGASRQVQDCKKLMVVINDELMDNHQMELAEALAERGYLMMLPGPSLLLDDANAVRVMEDVGSFRPRDFQGGNGATFGNVLDSFMGFDKTE
jgi:beta-1,4-N-acetylglucosaminyltransferase